MTTEGLYAEFFGLRERPFTLLPDPSLIYWSPQHSRAITVLRFGLMSRAPVTLISGDIDAVLTDGTAGEGYVESSGGGLKMIGFFKELS